jgi:GT2 family glycosyltransferase
MASDLRGGTPVISVIICTYRRETLALRAIRSVVEDGSAECEVLVIDQDPDGSLESRIRELLGPPPQLRYFRISTLGLSQARNLGAREAAGPVLAFLDDDAQARPGWLAGYRDAFARDTAPTMVGGRIMPEWEVPKPRWYPSSRITILGTYDIGESAAPFPDSDLPVGANFAILKGELLRLGGFSEQLGFKAGRRLALGGEDSLLGGRVRAAGGLILYEPRAVATHLIREEKLRLAYFLKRTFIEGMTQIVVLDGVPRLEAAFLLGAAKWHLLSVLGSPLPLWRCVAKRRTATLECLGEWLAATCLSLGVVYQCWRLHRERRRAAADRSPEARDEGRAMERPRSYADDWDEYVKGWQTYAKLEPTNQGRADLVYPGDEWGTEAEWDAYAASFLHPWLPPDGRGVAVEIGPGSGKYTLRVVDRVAQLLCFDVSEMFMELAQARLAKHGGSGTVRFELLKMRNCYEIQEAVARRGLLGEVDLFFSVDSMQHVELHTLIAYWLNAAASLRVGGHIVMTVATCTTAKGFSRLLDEAAWCYGGTRPSHQFYFLSKEVVHYCLGQLGFEVLRLEEGRDINVVARKVRPVAVVLQPVP